jgi:hypothetical protein
MALCASSTGCSSLSSADTADMSKYGAEGSSSQCGGGSGGGGYSSCPSSLAAENMLGSGCHSMGTDYYCDGPMTKSAKSSDTATTLGCTGGSYSGSGTSSGGSACPSSITGLGSGCHLMFTKSDGTNRYCNSEMNKHVDDPQPDLVVDGCASFTTADSGRSPLLAQILNFLTGFFR